MTITADTLITNTQSIASSAHFNVYALKQALNRYIESLYPTPNQLHNDLNAWLRADISDEDGFQARQLTPFAREFNARATQTIPHYENRPFAKIEPWEGDLSTIDTEPFANMLVGIFPDDTDYDAVVEALNTVSNLARSDTAPRIADAASAMRDDAAAHVAGLYIGPTPAGATKAIAEMVKAAHDAESAFERIGDVMFDEGYDIAILTTQARLFAAKASAFMRVKFQALAAVQDYLDAYIAELKAPYAIDQKGAEVTRKVHEYDIDQIVSKAEYNSAIRSRLVEYYSTLASYEAQATEFQKSLVKHNDWFRDFLRKNMDSSASLASGVSVGDGDASARRAAAAVSALGAVVSSAVTSFG